MNFFDILLGGLIAFGLVRGFMKGLFVELASLVALIAGLYGAIHFSYFVGDYLTSQLGWSEKYINLIAFIITFIIIILLVSLAGKLLTKIADLAMLGIVNKLAGAAFGALKIAVILGALLVFFDRTNHTLSFVKEETLEESVLYQPVRDIGAYVFSLVLKDKEEAEKSADTGNQSG